MTYVTGTGPRDDFVSALRNEMWLTEAAANSTDASDDNVGVVWETPEGINISFGINQSTGRTHIRMGRGSASYTAANGADVGNQEWKETNTDWHPTTTDTISWWIGHDGGATTNSWFWFVAKDPQQSEEFIAFATQKMRKPPGVSSFSTDMLYPIFIDGAEGYSFDEGAWSQTTNSVNVSNAIPSEHNRNDVVSPLMGSTYGASAWFGQQVTLVGNPAGGSVLGAVNAWGADPTGQYADSFEPLSRAYIYAPPSDEYRHGGRFFRVQPGDV